MYVFQSFQQFQRFASFQLVNSLNRSLAAQAFAPKQIAMSFIALLSKSKVITDATLTECLSRHRRDRFCSDVR
jgi:hypothetical protein